jgi:hypothetical protein
VRDVFSINWPKGVVAGERVGGGSDGILGISATGVDAGVAEAAMWFGASLGVTWAGAVHHVMARGDRREEVFRDDKDWSKFLGYLNEGAERYQFMRTLTTETDN